MKGYEPGISFETERSALKHDTRGDEREAVAFLADVAGSGPVLEFAVGTGRLALPLAERGLRVAGIDISETMVRRMREKPGGDAIETAIGDVADTRMPGFFSLVFVAWNSLFNVLTQAGQVACFRNAAAHLHDGGVFVVEAYVPTYLQRLPDDQLVQAEGIDVDEVRIGVLRNDPANQMLEQTHVSLSAEGVELNPVVQRYAWPGELDLMAELAGLRLRERWGDWTRAPFSSASASHVSVYVR